MNRNKTCLWRVLIVVGVLAVMITQCTLSRNAENEQYRQRLVHESTLYIYNHYENVQSIEYRYFEVNSFGLGSRTYSADSIVNRNHSFRWRMYWDYELAEKDTKMTAYESREHPEGNLSKKSIPANDQELPQLVEITNATKK